MKKILLATAVVLGMLGAVSTASADHENDFDNFFEWVADNN